MKLSPSGMAVLALIASLAVAGSARAAGAPSAVAASPEARSAALKKQGDAMMADLEYRKALDVYQQAYALSSDPALLYNRARAHQALSEYPEALDLFETFAQTAPPELKARVPKLDALIADVRSRVATLEVRCDVEGARVLVRDKDEGACDPAHPIRTRAGLAKIEVRANGYSPLVKELELRGGGEKTPFEARMTRALDAGKSWLSIETTPARSLVYVDARPLGPAPATAVIDAGRHVVLVRLDGYEDSKIDIELDAGQRRQMDLTLEKSRPVTSKWWFWTGIGAVVVGGTVLTYALLTTADPPSGTIPPGQVRGP